MIKRLIKLISIFLLFLPPSVKAQNFPWERPLKMAWSADGINFNAESIYQDSSGVPSVIRWKGDTLICAFQWFRQPMNSVTWDKVAVKFSYDNGNSWTQPMPIIINGFPSNYQRPFDPTLVKLNNNNLRLYFSSSEGQPAGGLDSTVNTYSASGNDGIHFTFETNARVDVVNNRVIDPAVIHFNNAWHYASPAGAPQDGAYHYVSPDGLNFNAVPLIPSDNNHNWTGNYMVNDSNELRFYGSSQNYIWYNSSPNGGVWNGFINTNIQGGDPSVVKIDDNNYLMIFVGNPYPNHLKENENETSLISVFPNPSNQIITIPPAFCSKDYSAAIYNQQGFLVHCTNINGSFIRIDNLASGYYWIHWMKQGQATGKISRFCKMD